MAKASGSYQFPYWDEAKVERRFKSSAAALMFCLLSFPALQLLAVEECAVLKALWPVHPRNHRLWLFWPFFHFFFPMEVFLGDLIPIQHNFCTLTATTNRQEKQSNVFNWIFSLCMYQEALTLYALQLEGEWGVEAAVFKTSLGHQRLWNSTFLKLGLDEVPYYSFLHLGFSCSHQFSLMGWNLP